MNKILFSTLNKLSKPEITDFKSFLEIPGLKVSVKAKQLFGLLENQLPEIVTPLTKGELSSNATNKYRKIWHETLYDKRIKYTENDHKRIKNLESELSNALKLFISFLELKENGVNHRNLLIEAYEKRGLKRLQKNELLKDIPPKESDLDNYFLNRFFVSQRYFQFLIKNHNRNNSAANKALKSLFTNLTRLYLYFGLRYIRVVQRRKLITNYQLDIDTVFLEKTLFSIYHSKSFDVKSPILKYYLTDFDLGKDKSQLEFEKLIEQFYLIKDTLSVYDKKQLIQGQLNFCSLAALYHENKQWKQMRLKIYETFFHEQLCYIGKNQSSKKIVIAHFENYLLLLNEFNPSIVGQEYNQYFDQLNFKTPAMKQKYKHVFKFYSQFFNYDEEKLKVDEIEKLIAKVYRNYSRTDDEYLLFTFEMITLKFYYLNKKLDTFRRELVSIQGRVKHTKRLGSEYKNAYISFIMGIKYLVNLADPYYSNKPLALKRLKATLKKDVVFERYWLNDQLALQLTLT